MAGIYLLKIVAIEHGITLAVHISLSSMGLAIIQQFNKSQIANHT